MTPEELQAAEQLLAQWPEYACLTDERGAKSWYNVAEIARGAGVSRDTARDWCEKGAIPGAIYYGPDIGWRVPRSGLIEYLAGLQRRQHQAR